MMEQINIDKSFEIETSRFVLRIPNKEDIPFVFSATRYPGFNDGMLWEAPENESELLEPLKRTIRKWEEAIEYTFTIVRKKQNELIGRISIRKTKEENVWETGFWTHPDSQNEGVMTEALAGILQFGFEQLKANKIQACHALWNKASEKVLKRNGMEFEKYLPHGFKKKGEWVAENLLSVGKEKWSDDN
jgi:ribosomal-protein-alanine N-acetyltransferase